MIMMLYTYCISCNKTVKIGVYCSGIIFEKAWDWVIWVMYLAQNNQSQITPA